MSLCSFTTLLSPHFLVDYGSHGGNWSVNWEGCVYSKALFFAERFFFEIVIGVGFKISSLCRTQIYQYTPQINALVPSLILMSLRKIGI